MKDFLDFGGYELILVKNHVNCPFYGKSFCLQNDDVAGITFTFNKHSRKNGNSSAVDDCIFDGFGVG